MPSGDSATPLGSLPTGISARRVLPFLRSKRETVLLSGLATSSSESSALKASGCELVAPVKRVSAWAAAWPG